MAVQALAAAGRAVGGVVRGAARAARSTRAAAGVKGAVDAAANLALQRWLDIAKVSLLGVSYLVFPLIVVVLLMAFELMLQYVRPSWQLALWRKVVYIVTVLLTLFLCLIVIGTILYFREHPGEACAAFGGFWGTAAGKLGVCSLANELFEAIL